MNIWRLTSFGTLFFLINLSSCALHPSRFIESSAGTELVFVTPVNHSEEQNPVHIKFRLSGMGHPGNKGKEISEAHVHVLVDQAVPRLDRVMPHQEAGVIEVDKGKRSILLTLPAGTHKIQLIAADAWHRPHLPPLISEIRTIKVTE